MRAKRRLHFGPRINGAQYRMSRESRVHTLHPLSRSSNSSRTLSPLKKKHAISTSLVIYERAKHFSHLLRRIWRLVGRKWKGEKETRRRRNAGEFFRSRDATRDVVGVSRVGRKSWISVRASTVDDTSGRAKRRRSERDEKSRGSPPVSGEERKVYRKDIREVAGRQERAADARATATNSRLFHPPPPLPPTIKRHQHLLVRGFCAVATECRLQRSPAGHDTRSNAGLLVVECRDMVKVVGW